MIRSLIPLALALLPWSAAAAQADGDWEIVALEEDDLFGDTIYQYSYDRASVARDGVYRTVHVFERNGAPRWQLLRYDCAARTVQLIRRKGVGTDWEDVNGRPRSIPAQSPLQLLYEAIC